MPGSEPLGFPPDARLLVVNCDDLGMYEAVDDAVVRCVEDGIASSCSLMVPCPAAPHAMRLLGERPEIPFGVHLTLVCDTAEDRWSTVTPPEQVPSLLRATGEPFTPAEVPDLLAQARLTDVEREFRAQVDTVLAAGLAPTHLDWHCLADGGRPDIFDLTVALAREYGLAMRVWLDRGRRWAADRGLPVVDHDFVDSFALDVDTKADTYERLLRTLPEGLTEWAVHPALGDARSQRVDPDGWRVRSSDYEFLTSPRAREIVREEGIVVTDYRRSQELWRS